MQEAGAFLQSKKAAIAEAKTAYAEFEATPPPEDPDAEPVEPPPKPEEVASSMKAAPLTGKGPVLTALCIDTLGTEVQVSEKYVGMLDKAAKSVAEYRKRYDTYAVYQQAAWNQFSLPSMSYPQLLHLFEACKMDLDALENMTEEER